MREAPAAAKPTVEGLGIDVSAQHWRRSGSGPGAVEIAFVQAGGRAPDADADQRVPEAGADQGVPGAGADQWVLMRVASDPAERVLVYDRFEWECFLDGAKNGEFDDAT
jgi:hypothetical protein